jgi:hypothetical protein
MRSGSEFGQADSPIGWVRNTPQQPPWLRGSRNCLLWDGANIRRKTVALIFNPGLLRNQAAGIDAKWKLACSGSIHRHDPLLSLASGTMNGSIEPLQPMLRLNCLVTLPTRIWP